ncbi:FkbM family methyltransferase [Alphaproteobacteria bacterium]|nr:FkbM family methyltransferase [Alphaproteobacteria bacterium]
MKKILVKLYKTLPLAIQKNLSPKILSLVKFYCSCFGIQFLDHITGRVKVPFSSKVFLKRSFAQQGEDLILDRILTRILQKDIRQSHVYVDIGAYDPIDHSVTYLLYLRGWSGVVFDPSNQTKKLFKKWRKRDVFINSVVGDTDGVDVDFYFRKTDAITQIDDQSLSSTKYPPQHRVSDYEKVSFKQVNINSELKRQNIKKIDFLNIDVEGAELEILQTLDFEYFKPSVIALEIHGNDLLKCFETDEAKLILSKGYRVVGSAVITQFFVRSDEMHEKVL